MIRALFAVAVLSILAMSARAGRAQDSDTDRRTIERARDEAEASYRTKLVELARWCDTEDLPKQSLLVRNWLPVRDPLKTYVFKLDDSLAPPSTPRTDIVTREFWIRFVKLRTAQSDALFRLAKQAHAAKQFALTFDLVRETCRENPEHAQARAILGYIRHSGGWALPDTARRIAAGQVYDEKFGWLPAGRVDRYRQGWRYARGKWISADEDEHQHAAIASGWRIDSEHYVVTTNHSLEEGVRLSRRLENLYDVWRHVFVDYYTPESEMQRWFERAETAEREGTNKAAPTVVRRQHQVTYFRNRDEYQNALRPRQPQIDITLGIYFAQSRTAYFFADDEQYAGTLFHEATHQLFQETRPTAKDIGAKANFPLVEAVACYLESLAEQEHWYTVGGMDTGRVPAARKRLLVDSFYVPFREVTAMGMQEMQRDDRLPRLYSQIAGQALFLLNADRGRYHRALVDCLIAVYTNKDDEGTLAKTTGRTYEQLDEEYRGFMRGANAE